MGRLIDAFVRHLIQRYGAAEVRQWPFEVWNEPNLDGFSERADQKAYFDLYALTALTIKRIDPAIPVGGPSTAGAAWVPELFEEPGPPTAPFHGGFGMMTREGVRKPSWFAHKYLNALRGNEIPSTDEAVLAAADGRKTAVLVRDWQHREQPTSNGVFFGKPVPAIDALPVQLDLRNVSAGNYRLCRCGAPATRPTTPTLPTWRWAHSRS